MRILIRDPLLFYSGSDIREEKKFASGIQDKDPASATLPVIKHIRAEMHGTVQDTLALPSTERKP
jgi:hypothetical protein